jgi:hypothetical protein
MNSLTDFNSCTLHETAEAIQASQAVHIKWNCSASCHQLIWDHTGHKFNEFTSDEIASSVQSVHIGWNRATKWTSSIRSHWMKLPKQFNHFTSAETIKWIDIRWNHSMKSGSMLVFYLFTSAETIQSVKMKENRSIISHQMKPIDLAHQINWLTQFDQLTSDDIVPSLHIIWTHLIGWISS